MTDDTPTYSSKPTSETGSSESKAAKEWEAFQRDLDTLGRQLAELGAQGATLGQHFLDSLQERFKEVQAQATTYKRAAEEQIEQSRREAEGTLKDARTHSTEAAKDAARELWERSQPLREGAKDVGEGLARAWGELRSSFGKAAQRLQTEETTSAAEPSSTSNEPHKTV
jgi:hypothetical protein